MIAEALRFITNELDSFLKRSLSVNDATVILSGLVNLDGSLSVPQNNVLTVTLVTIEEERSIAKMPGFNRPDGVIVKQAPPMYINVYLLISAVFDAHHYEEGLKRLSMAISFFQQHPYFTSEQIGMPNGMDKLTVELITLDPDRTSSMWKSLGVSYRPSVVYKVRMLKIDSVTMPTILPEIQDIKG